MPYNYTFKLDFVADAKYIEALKYVNKDQHDILVMTHKAQPQVSNEKMAAATGLPLNTVKTRLFRARCKIRKWRMQDGIKPVGRVF